LALLTLNPLELLLELSGIAMVSLVLSLAEKLVVFCLAKAGRLLERPWSDPLIPTICVPAERIGFSVGRLKKLF
jgi:hypothetical protein